MDFLDLIFPKNCLECGKEGRYLCRACVNKTPLSSPICGICHRNSYNGITHAHCIGDGTIDRLISIWAYRGIIKKAVLEMKYKYAYLIAKELAYYASWELEKVDLDKSMILIPVPLHWRKENFRGFNQSELVGREISKKIGVRFFKKLIIKHKSTLSQVDLPKEKRALNVQGSFLLKSKKIIKGGNFIVFDDIFTTGATMGEIAGILKRNGAKSVTGISLAR